MIFWIKDDVTEENNRLYNLKVTAFPFLRKVNGYDLIFSQV